MLIIIPGAATVQAQVELQVLVLMQVPVRISELGLPLFLKQAAHVLCLEGLVWSNVSGPAVNTAL